MNISLRDTSVNSLILTNKANFLHAVEEKFDFFDDVPSDEAIAVDGMPLSHGMVKVPPMFDEVTTDTSQVI